ncbi:MAG TPA: UDP-3-O-(3-hydroxymyristoyl)glucosamine N-acyltransferase [Candidatus Eisenbacteria bacterium]|nr:UDP-3-O-(3-hydroxymyristoyl)glucosamine N-acyltransferase [Candidatus Eisenbacteria bacterium]
MVTRTLSALAAELGGEVIGDGAIVIGGVAGIREAMPGDVTFLANSRYDAHLDETRASAVICSREPRIASVPLLVVDNPYLAFQRAVRIFRPEQHRPAPGIHPTAVVSPEAVLGRDVAVGACCVVEAGAKLGDRVVLMGGGYVGHGAIIGDDTWFYPRVVLREDCVVGARCIVHPGAVIGSDGFGFAFDAGRYHKVPQVGNVVIGDDVEIGANTTIDRATTHSTRIGEGTKIDNLVQIGHNVVVGKHCIIVAQVGVSGSTELEDHVTLGGQAGLVGHIKIGKGAMVGAQSGVTKSVPAETVVTGYPAMQHSLWRRLQALFHRLPDLMQRTKDVEERVAELERAREREREGVR